MKLQGEFCVLCYVLCVFIDVYTFLFFAIIVLFFGKKEMSEVTSTLKHHVNSACQSKDSKEELNNRHAITT